jgi:CDP-diglyceride synthetase
MASKQRVICGLSVAAVWLAVIFLLPFWTLSGLVAVSAGVCLYELCAMLKKGGYVLPFWELLGATALWFANTHCAWVSPMPLLAVMVAALFFRVLLDSKIQKPMETATFTVGSFLYIPVMLSCFITLVSQFSVKSVEGLAITTNYGPGIFVAFVLALVTKMSDTGGYFVGSAIGKHKMCPRLSPGKSWEGTAGGYAFSLVTAGIVVACAHLFAEATVLSGIRALTHSLGATLWFFFSIIILVTVGICGDLLESLFKRQCGVKDSSALFPAMGGFFDTFDSIIFIPATMLFLIEIGHKVLA